MTECVAYLVKINDLTIRQAARRHRTTASRLTLLGRFHKQITVERPRWVEGCQDVLFV